MGTLVLLRVPPFQGALIWVLWVSCSLHSYAPVLRYFAAWMPQSLKTSKALGFGTTQDSVYFLKTLSVLEYLWWYL